ncbi:MAG: RHS repeat-associated core domain-containing protein [Terriglobales bacterium]
MRYTACLPYGDGLSCPGPEGALDANAASPLHFTGQHHDDETGLDHFPVRNYTSAWGRWMTPDWAASPASVPYASFSNPQTLDLYAYALGNPATNADPDGHWCFLGKLGTTCPAKQPAKSADPTHPDNPLSFQLEEWAALAFAAGPGQAVQQARQLGRSFKEHPYISGAMFGLSLFVGPEAEDAGMAAEEAGTAAEAADSTANAGTTTQIGNATSPGSIYNLRADLTPEEFGDNLEQSGYSRTDLGKGVVQYTKGDRAYTVYPDAASTGEPAVQVKVAGRVVSKLRLGP